MANLFILPSLLGDSILTTGAIDKLKDEPSVIVATPLTAPLFEDLPNLEDVIIIKKEPWKKHWLKIWNATRGRSWDRIVDFRGSGLAYILRAKKRHVWGQTSDQVHKVIQVGNCMKSEELMPPTLWFSKERLKRTQLDRPTFAVAPIPGWRGKQWPIENFVTLLTKFCKTYPEAQVAVFAAPREKELLEPLLKALPKDQCLDTIGMNLLDNSARIHHSQLFIGNDSGLMHLSASVRTPTIALFGPSNEDIYGPWSELTPSPHRAVRGEPFTGNVRQRKENTQNYMGALKVGPVWDVVQERWEALNKSKKSA